MPRGGARPNSGPPKGYKPKPRQVPPRLPAMITRITSDAALKALARTYTNDALMIYVDIMKNEASADGDKIKAATEILNRGWGRAAVVEDDQAASRALVVNVINFSDADLGLDSPQIEGHVVDGEAS
jgi:hypothetical protein